MAVTLINLLNYTFGVTSEETVVAINVREVSTEVVPELNETLAGKSGEVKGKAVGPGKGTVRVSGEHSSATNPTLGFTTAATVANTTTHFGRSGGLYLVRGSVTETRDGFKTIDAEFESYAGIS